MSDPPETDLDYYSRPENYTGSNLQSLQKFSLAKQKQEKLSADDGKKEKKKKAGFDLFKRYKHILKGFVDGDEDEDDDEEQEEDESKSKKSKYEDIPEEEHEPSEASTEKGRKTDTPEDERTRAAKKYQKEDERIQSPIVRVKYTEIDDQSSSRESSPDQRGADLKVDVSPSPRDSICSMTSISGAKKSLVSVGRSSLNMRYGKQSQLARELRAKLARENFRKTILFVKIVLKLSQSAGGGSDPSEGMKTFTDIASEVETSSLKSSGLSFDPSYFKAKKEINISNEVKGILSLPSDQRSPDQVQTAMFGLQIMRSFAEYPLHMQEKLAKVAWYEVVPPKRIIIRQGHFAENFYFILSGQAVVTLLLRDPKTGQSFVKTATIMRRGMSFGELALLHHSRRTATVTSQGTVQLLTIGREDFFDIFMSGAGPDQIPDHIKFVSQCDFMKDWPIERLLEHPEHCLLHFFKRNVVIVRDSTNSEWLYVVKSGSCQVLKQLKGVTPKIGWKANIDEKDYLKLPKTGTHLLGPKIDTGIRKRRKVKSADDISRLKAEKKQGNIAATAFNLKTENKKFSKSEYSKNPTTQKAHFSPIRDENSARKIKYVIPEKCRPPKPPEPPNDPNGGKPQPVFVSVESLKPKDVFGLETIQFEGSVDNPMTVVTLVSRGAECIMLNKEFFTKHATEEVKKLIRQQVCPYPDESTFQDNLQIKANWELYKANLLDDLTSRL